MYQMTLLGLVAFVDVTPAGGLVLLPNGKDFGSGIPNHFARFYIEDDRLIQDQTDWWPPVNDPAMAQRHVTVFQINSPSDLTISGLEEERRPRFSEVASREEEALRLKSNPRDVLHENDLDASRHTSLMPSLNDLDRHFKVDPDGANTIARFTIRHGTLYAHRLAESAVSTLLVHSDPEPVTITARTHDGETKRIVVKDGTEILLSNMSILGAAHPDQDAPSHINIYRRLDPKSKRELREPKTINPSLTPLFGPSRHPFVQYIRTRFGDVPRPGCSSLVYSSKGHGCRLW